MRGISRRQAIVSALAVAGHLACDRENASTSKPSAGASGGAGGASVGRLTIGVSFDTLQTEYWVASMNTLKAELASRSAAVMEAVADNDANRQLEQVRNFVARKVDGIIIAPKDAQTVLPMIKAANRAGVPIVLYNRPPADNSGKSVTVVADNYAITKDTVTYLCEQAKGSGRKYKALILIGDLGDINAVGRRDGFNDAVKGYADVVEVVAQIPTEWNQEKALAGMTNAMQAHPDIDFVFASSDFLFPSVASALKAAGRYKKVGEPGHVLLGGFDGDATAYRMLLDGYLDADGVQDLKFECAQSVQAVVDLKAGKDVPPVIRDPGVVIHQGNLKDAAARMWGATVGK
jgi:inositol transport system substrate-binding protein